MRWAWIFILLAVAVPTRGEPVQIIVGKPSSATMRQLERAEHPKGQTSKIRGKFRELDQNRDGQISRTELEAANEKRLRDFERIDKNSDGAVSQQEWRESRGYRSRKGTQRAPL